MGAQEGEEKGEEKGMEKGRIKTAVEIILNGIASVEILTQTQANTR